MEEYNPAHIEAKWQAEWEKRKVYAVKTDDPRPKYYCLGMFPYPSGSGLHVGHPLGYTATDILSRYKRLRGYAVLHPMGFDAFGLPAEQHAVATGEHPGEVTKRSCARFTEQLKRLGFSYDWDRAVATCEPEYYRWTQWIFLQLFDSWFDEVQQRARPISELPIPEEVQAQGVRAVELYQAENRLAYYDEAFVNWCPALGTVLANEEVIDGKSERGGHDVVRRPMKQWLLRITAYCQRLLTELEDVDWPEAIKEQQRNWIGRREGASIGFKIPGQAESLTVFTTRPDTLFGVTFVVVAPEHPLLQAVTAADQKQAVTTYVEQAGRLSEVDRTAESRKKTGVPTGGVVINPLSGEEIPVWVADYVLASYGTGAVMGVPGHDERDFEFAKCFGLPVRGVVLPPDGLEVERIRRGEQVFTNSGKLCPWGNSPFELSLADLPNEDAGSRIVAELERVGLGRRTVTYKLRDWLFSRQRYWGEPIPVIHWDDGGISALNESDLPLTLPEVPDYKPLATGESPLGRAQEWLRVTDPTTGRMGRRETNTMPQWAGSCWYYLRYIDPSNDQEPWGREAETKWMPVDMYIGGAEHAVLHLLYARFWHKVLYDLGYVSTREPFQRLFNQGTIVADAFRNSRGSLVAVDEVDQVGDQFVHRSTGDVLQKIVAKMSKSLRNVVDPLEVIEQYGADTLRVYLMFMGPLEAMRPWDSKAISGSHRFLRRAWQLVTQALARPDTEVSEPDEVGKLLHRTIKKVTEDIEGLRFNTAISALMEFINGAMAKPLALSTLKSFSLLLSPFAPHLAEELWARLGEQESLTEANWPLWNDTLLVEEVVTVVIQVNGKKRGSVEVAASIADDALQGIVVESLAGTPYQPSSSAKFFVVRAKGDSATPKLVNVLT